MVPGSFSNSSNHCGILLVTTLCKFFEIRSATHCAPTPPPEELIVQVIIAGSCSFASTNVYIEWGYCAVFALYANLDHDWRLDLEESFSLQERTVNYRKGRLIIAYIFTSNAHSESAVNSAVGM